MGTLPLTPQQRHAVTASGHSVIVSAAAGSGKTAVLAQRCAHLICDLPPDQRCNVDQILVLTFTDAAAAEMRGRIEEALHTRLQDDPGNHRLREQIALLDAAHISTVHSFCHWLIRRWFNEAGLDPTTSVLDADEAALLKRETLESLFDQLYQQTDTTAPHGSNKEPDLDQTTSREPPPTTVSPELAAGFNELVEVYGLGEDRDVATLVLQLHDFVASLPDPDGWLNDALTIAAEPQLRAVPKLKADLERELTSQIEYCEMAAARAEEVGQVGQHYATQIQDYVEHLREWSSALQDVDADHSIPDAHTDEAPTAPGPYETVRSSINEFAFNSAKGPRLGKDTDPAILRARDRARQELTAVKDRLFRDRLKKRFALFSVGEWVEGLEFVAPFIATIAGMVTAFRNAYSAEKRKLATLDFSDLERFAFDLLHLPDALDQASDIARSLQRRFAHVLVDEFQDINPIQHEIIRLASREASADLPNNLFVVGDVKQSIYRFRLAEPTVFAHRHDAFREETCADETIALQANFRSRPEILDAVNLVFSRLMSPAIANTTYDEEAHLHPGREVADSDISHAVELHLLERNIPGEISEEGASEVRLADPDDPSRWTPLEREAYLIGSLIREWMAAGRAMPDGQPLAFRDMAILLRAAKVNAERMASILTAMDIPTYANVGGALFGTREVRDAVAALQVLDNPRQDIPLAAVLRSGILAEPFSEDDLVEIRRLDRSIPFHEAAREYAAEGAQDKLRHRLDSLWRRIERFRQNARRRPLAEVLWELYQDHGLLAYACGLPRGEQRHANLLRLHELARKFGSFRRQGLHRFLRFIESLEQEDRQPATAPAIGESEDVVRIMSIHQSKGLEFPVVFAAGLGTQFNLGDRTGRMIFERRAGIGLRVVDVERMIEYPSLVHAQVVAEIERQTRAEELRVLYVAMTRAREKLVLVGSKRGVESLDEGTETTTDLPPLSNLSIAAAVTPLDWLIPAFSSAPAGAVRGLGQRAGDRPTVDVKLHDAADIAEWSVRRHDPDREDAVQIAAARSEALPANEPYAPDDAEVGRVVQRLDYVYPHLAAGTVRAAMAASEFKGTFDLTATPDQRLEPAAHPDVSPAKAGPRDRPSPDAAAERGTIMHRVLQHLDFTLATDAAGVASELQRLKLTGVVSEKDETLVDEAGLAWFGSTPLATAIREAGDGYRREFQYLATESPAYLDRTLGPAGDDAVLVRGMVDGIVPFANGIEIVDFKTDAITAALVPQRVVRYRAQMELYARAMSRIWRQPVRKCWLVFLGAREVVEVSDLTLS